MASILDIIKAKAKKVVEFVDKHTGYDHSENQETLWYIKRHCKTEDCRNTPLDDPKAVKCFGCKHYEERGNFKVQKQDMRIEKNRREVFEYIRETCDNRKCYGASHRDKDAFICNRCADLRENHFEVVRVELELKEDEAIRHGLRLFTDDTGNPDKVHSRCSERNPCNIMPRLLRFLGFLSCQPCKCALKPYGAEPCKCGKSTLPYRVARKDYLMHRKHLIDLSNILAYHHSECFKADCLQASRRKITRFNIPWRDSSWPPCECWEQMSKPGYSKSVKKNLSSIMQEDEVKKYMEGTCKNAKCSFSPEQVAAVKKKKPAYCLACHDALEYNFDGIKKQMLESKKARAAGTSSGATGRGSGQAAGGSQQSGIIQAGSNTEATSGSRRSGGGTPSPTGLRYSGSSIQATSGSRQGGSSAQAASGSRQSGSNTPAAGGNRTRQGGQNRSNTPAATGTRPGGNNSQASSERVRNRQSLPALSSGGIGAAAVSPRTNLNELRFPEDYEEFVGARSGRVLRFSQSATLPVLGADGNGEIEDVFGPPPAYSRPPPAYSRH